MIGEDAYVVALDGVDMRPFETLSSDVITASMRAVNYAANRARTLGAAAIRQQVAFPASYLNPSQGRLVVSNYATQSNLEAKISARTRPTMLARFATSGTVNKAGVTVEVAPGFARFMKRAFLIRLPSGGGDVDTKGNLGLAIRLKPNEVIHNKHVMVRLKGNLYLLYGPSISQVFTTVREDIGPEVEGNLADEFVRLMELAQ